MTSLFGSQLMLDCYGCNNKKLKNKSFISSFLKNLTKLLDMKQISKPFVIPYKTNKKTFDKGGISAVILIATSHISIHTFPQNNYMNIDIFSCKKFSRRRVENFVKKEFGVKKIEKRYTLRGKMFKR